MSCGREKAGGRTGAGKGCPKRSGGAALGSAGEARPWGAQGCPPGVESARKNENSTEEQFRGADFVIRLVPAAGEEFWRLPAP